MKKLMSFIILLSLLLALPLAVYADSDSMEEQLSIDNTQSVENESFEVTNAGLVRDVDMDEIVGHIESKGWEIVEFLKTINQPVMVIFFIFGLIFIAVGALGNSSLMGRGLLVLFVVAIVYASIFFAEDWLSIFREWAKI